MRGDDYLAKQKLFPEAGLIGGLKPVRADF